MNWAKRVLIGTGLAVTSLLAVPAAAGATATTGCYTACAPPSTGSSSQVVAPTSALPFTGGNTTTNGSSSLPFTGADIGELAVVGAGAVLAGGLLLRRRRNALA